MPALLLGGQGVVKYWETTTMNCYRVWMKDGYAGLYDGETEQGAKDQAVAAAKQSCRGAAMSKAEYRKATTVDYAELMK